MSQKKVAAAFDISGSIRRWAKRYKDEGVDALKAHGD